MNTNIQILGLHQKATILLEPVTTSFYNNSSNEIYTTNRIFIYKKDIKNRSLIDEDGKFLRPRDYPFSFLVSHGITNLKQLVEVPFFQDTYQILSFNKSEHKVLLKSLTTNEEISMGASDLELIMPYITIDKGVFSGVFTFTQKGGSLVVTPYSLSYFQN